MSNTDDQDLVLLTGATGYVGGRLLEALEERGGRVRCMVRCMVRRPEYFSRKLTPEVSVVAGDVLDPSTLGPALEGVGTAYYLVHSLGSSDFEEQDRVAAENFGRAAKGAGVSRIVYLGGLGDSGDELSKHLRSRQETGEVLRASGVPVIEFRASIVLGSGSLSFELIRALVERLPVMVCPRWVQVKAQPIHIQDVVAYLIAALDRPAGESAVYEIGGAEQVSYRQIMREYARQRGLRRFLLPVPFLTPNLSSLWLGLTTPVYARVGRKLIGSIKNPTVVTDDAAAREFDIRPVGLEESIALAMRNEDRLYAATAWTDAVSSAGAEKSYGGVTFGARLVDSRSRIVDVPPDRAFAPIRRIGGRTGWYYGNWLWRIRGYLDLLIGGPGLRRGRRNQKELAVGDAVDFWRVESYEPDRRLRLFAEMKLPGRAWLEFEVKPAQGGGSEIHQTAVFDPIGLFGRLYWYGIYPLHGLIFNGMLKGITSAAQSDD